MPDTPIVSSLVAPEASVARPVIPGYELLRRIGQGSYGEVWVARDGAGMFRAVKVVYRRTFEHDRPFEREFSGIKKFEPVSRTHSSQVAVLQVGRDQDAGYFYYVMELADDENSGQQINPLAYVPKTIRSEVKKRGRLPYGECLEIGLALTTALEHLHKHGLIHRDIKPSNIIFVNGVPKLADIGLVTDVGATISYVGTEGFLPPEGPVGPLADIYSLGKVLYEIATGRDRLDFPELPTLLGSAGEKDRLLELNLVFLKACQNDVRKRYQSAHEMHADLALLQSGRSLRRARALERRLTNLTRLAGGAGIISLVVVGSYFWMERQQLAASRRKEAIAAQAEELARKEKDQLLKLLVLSHVASGSNVLAQGDVATAVLWFAQAAKEDHPTNQPVHLARIEPLLARCPRLLAVLAEAVPLNTLALSSDGRSVAVASEDGTVQLCDATTGAKRGEPFSHPAAALCVAFGPDDRRLATGCANGVVQVWNPVTQEPVAGPLKHGGAVRHLSFHKGGQWLLAMSEEPVARLWDANGGRLRLMLKHEAAVLDGAFSPDGQYVATASADRTARLWRLDAADVAASRLEHRAPVRRVVFSFDSRRIATVSGDAAHVWDVASGEPAEWRMEHGGPVTSLAFSPDNRSIITTAEDRTARIWDARTGKLRLPPIDVGLVARAVSFSPDGRYFLLAGGTAAQIRSATTGAEVRPAIPHSGSIQQAIFAADGQRVLTASADGAVRVVDLWSGIALLSLIREAVTSQALAWQPQLLGGPAVDEDHLVMLAEILSGRAVNSSGQQVEIAGPALQKRFEMLRNIYPTLFQPTDLRLWHLREADTSQKEKHWFGVVFHLDRATASGATDARLRSRRDEAAAYVAKSDVASPPAAGPGLRIPSRPAEATPPLVDLGPYYNASLSETWLRSPTLQVSNDLSVFPPSVQKLNGVFFDARGLIQLSSSALENLGAPWPRESSGIAINRKCRRLHFLHGAVWDAPFGTPIGGYRVHYANGDTREVKLVFGVNVREWWASPQQVPITSEAAMAWQGANPASRAVGMAVRLYQMTWLNRLPDVEIRSIDFFSAMAKPAPFLLAVTAE